MYTFECVDRSSGPIGPVFHRPIDHTSLETSGGEEGCDPLVNMNCGPGDAISPIGRYHITDSGYGHRVPTAHNYTSLLGTQVSNIYALADKNVLRIIRTNLNEYAIFVAYGCEVYYYLGHLSHISQRLQNAVAIHIPNWDTPGSE